ncbi:aconitate hydratase AcnA [Paraliomyxa miuraensis]|uniref:aconitate hydratase AcnA n=1 Tax=Paraliomyxa miuraensis TaxID=376150 RepID=UPI002251A558|nr:aconitate hydratase AcnA [Paraliomyxa miuraensis]MCX4241181.1 aconitate hydratase AcnA [Paraliomyxa miuraensis]
MTQNNLDSFGARSTLTVGDRSYEIYRLDALRSAGVGHVDRLPFSLRVLVENLLRNEDGVAVTQADITAAASWDAKAEPTVEIAYHPARVLLQDFTGVPAVVDLAAMRDAIKTMGGDPQRINPLEPADLVIDHSVQIDHFGTDQAFGLNVQLEYQRNRERYAFLRWGQESFGNFSVVPPGTGICHQVNLEYLGRTVWTKQVGDVTQAYPDTLVGTDSHTTMINGLSVLGWGVGGIEAEAAMLGQPVSMLLPQVVGFRLHGTLAEGATATDLVLTVTQMLRKKGVVGKFVEFYGPGLDSLSLPDRATIANMAPEYGATCGFFPIDDETLSFLRFTNRPQESVALVEAYAKEQGLFRTKDTPDPEFTDTLELDLSTVEPSIAGPKRPQDRIPLRASQGAWRELIGDKAKAGPVAVRGKDYSLSHGSVVIAAITSCTNTSNPSVLVAAGLLARKAAALGLRRKPWVKTSLAPGSRVVTEYLAKSGLLNDLETLGFNVVGYGCTTCIGNSGPLADEIVEAIDAGDLVAASVLSGNRNFEGRISPNVRANYLASPPLVVAYAIAGHMDFDLQESPIGQDASGNDVFLKDVWPSPQEVRDVVRQCLGAEMFAQQYASVFEGDESWQRLATPKGELYAWDDGSTYVRNPPYFEGMSRDKAPLADITGARVLAKLGDSVTTDHISPAGNIPKSGPAGKYLVEHGVEPKDFNSFGARRGNHEVMIRGTFANIRLRNQLAPGTEGGVTRHIPSGEQMSIYDASVKYRDEGVPLVVLGGVEYGTGSSRDWAAKGTILLGVKAVIVKSFERIHRSNLVGMGVLPCVYKDGEDAQTLGLTGEEEFSITGIAEGLTPKKMVKVSAKAADGSVKEFEVVARLDTPNEVEYYENGGILQYVLRRMLKE